MRLSAILQCTVCSGSTLWVSLPCHQAVAVRHLGLTHESQALAQYAKVRAC